MRAVGSRGLVPTISVAQKEKTRLADVRDSLRTGARVRDAEKRSEQPDEYIHIHTVTSDAAQALWQETNGQERIQG